MSLPSDEASDWAPVESRLPNRDLLLLYLLPYLAYVGLAAVLVEPVPVAVDYGIRLVLVGLLLVGAWRWYAPLAGPRSRSGSVLAGIGVGALGCAVWVGLLLPFTDPAGDPLDPAAFVLRVLVTALVVPLFEELFIRGYVFRLVLQWQAARRAGDPDALMTALDRSSIHTVRPGQWSVAAIAISTVFFSLGHEPAAWLACVAYSLLLCGLWVVRQDLLALIVAHGVTNLALALYIAYTGQWGLW